jgi:NAD(P)-dependent dehydrogenase (short-subunit alcohol dehydrogenase family)
MSKKVWFITGAGRGMGVDFAKAALAAGHAVVATGRDPDRVSRALGPSNDLLAVKLDVTRRADAEAAVRAGVDRFGRIDVLVNNAASFYAGYFEELSPEQMDRQLAASLTGPMNVTHVVVGSLSEREPEAEPLDVEAEGLLHIARRKNGLDALEGGASHGVCSTPAASRPRLHLLENLDECPKPPQRGRQLHGRLHAHLGARGLENQKAPGRLRAFRGFG